MIAALYIRVSTEDQLEFSPDAQKRALIEYAKKNGYLIDDRYIFVDEGISGTSAKKRPNFMRMIATAKSKPKPFDAILVHKFDRFARSREDSVVYKSLLRKECGIKVISITEKMDDDKFSVILEAMLEAMAEYYSLNLSDEVMKGMTEKARRGGLQSKSILGYDIIDNKRIINIEESKIVIKAFEMCIAGESVAKIARYFNNLGLTNKNGKPFDSRRIKYMIENQVYIGTNIWNRTKQVGTKIVEKPKEEWIIVENAHDPIVTKETWDSAQESLKTWHKTTKPASSEYKHWLGGLLRCSSCGSMLTFKHMEFKRKDGSKRIADGYQCCKYKRGACNTSNYISIENMEQHIINILTTTLETVNDSGSLESINIDVLTSSDDTYLLEAQLDKLNNKMKLAKNAYLNEIDTLEEYKANKIMIQKEIKEVTQLISSVKKPVAPIKEFKSIITTALEILQDDSIGIQAKNKYLKGFISCIIVDKANDTLTTKFYYNS